MAAGASVITDIGSKLFGNIVTGLITALLVLVVVGIAGYIIYYFSWYKKQFDTLVKVTSDRAHDPSVFFDWAAIFKDRKTGGKYVRLLKTKVEMPVPPFFVFQKTNMGDFAEIHRTSEDTFYWLVSPKINKKKMISLKGRYYPIARAKQVQLEQDVYRILRMKEQNKSMIDPEGVWSKILQLLPILIPAFIMLFIFWIFMDKIPGVLSQLTELVQSIKDLGTAQVAEGIIPVLFLGGKKWMKR